MQKKVLFALSAGVLVAVCSFLISRELWSRMLSPTPFIATVLETQYRPGGSVSWIGRWTYAVRSDGSEVTIREARLPNHQPVQSKVILDLSAKTRVSIEPGTESTITHPLSRKFYDQRATVRGPTCVSEPEPERRSVSGFETLREYTEFPTNSPGNPTEVIQIERWVAPALSCLRLAETFTRGSPQGPAFRIEREVVSLEFREPPADWFAIPSGYTERSPSEFSEEHARRFGKPGIRDFGLQQLEQIYHESRKNVAQ